jgi:hypothetical protein
MANLNLKNLLLFYQVLTFSWWHLPGVNKVRFFLIVVLNVPPMVPKPAVRICSYGSLPG